MPSKLNIAHCVEFYPPSVGGMQEVVKQLSERMVIAGHRVSVFTSVVPERTFNELNGVYIQAFQVQGNAVRGLSGDLDGYWKALQKGDFDIVTLFAAQQWTADAVLPRSGELKAKKIFVPTGFSKLHDPKYAEYFALMAGWMRGMDLNVFLSRKYRDIQFAQSNGIAALTVIPNGASEEEFGTVDTYDLRADLGITREQQVLIHVGSFTGAKGHIEAIRIFLAADTKDAVLVFVGNGIKKFEQLFRDHWRFLRSRFSARSRNKRICFLELDRPRTVAAMKQADLFFFPSRVECSPIVLFESMAAGVPFLSSRAGNAEEIVEWSRGGWTMSGRTNEKGEEEPDIKKGARMLGELLAHPDMLKSAGEAGNRVWKERFTWQRITDQYLTEYLRLCGSGHA